MNSKSTLVLATVAIALLGTGAAFAQEITPDSLARTPASMTRDQVSAQLQQARKDGSIRAWSVGYIEPQKSVKTRAEVRAEAIAALRDGEIADLNSEAYAFEDHIPAHLRVGATVAASPATPVQQ